MILKPLHVELIILSRFVAMSEELPKRLFKEGEEPRVTQINNNCRIDYIIRKFQAWLPKELDVVKKDPVFHQIFKLHENGLGYSARVIHSFLCRELVTFLQHELWFVFARRPLRFSLQEFHAVTGFECDTHISIEEFEEWKYDGGFWSKVLRRKDGTITLFNLWTKDKEAVKKWKNADRIRLIYLAIILCVVLARDEKANIPLKYIAVVMDLDRVRRYPWGVAAYDLLCKSIAKNRSQLKEKTTSYVLDGFSYALQIWAMEAVPKIGKLCGKKLDKGFKDGPRCINWMGAAKVSYEEIIRLEEIITPKDDIYPYISWTGNYDVVKAQAFRRDDDVEDDRIKVLMEMIKKGHDFSEHVWETEENEVISLSLDDESAVNDEASVNVEAAESDDDFQTPKGSKNVGSRSKRGKKRLPDRGMEKRKHKVLASGAKQAPFNEDMKAFMTQLFEHNFSGMEQRIQKQMAETFEQMRTELKQSRKEASVEVELGEPSPTKPSTSQAPLRRSTRGDGSETTFDVNYSEADDLGRGIGTQGVEGLSQTSYVPGFDPSQDKKEEDWWTPMTSVRGSVDNPVKKEKTEMNTAPPPSQWEKWCKRKGHGLQLSDSPLPEDASPQASLYYISEESWKGFTEWALKPIPLTIGPTCFNLSVATRVVSAGKWLGNEVMNLVLTFSEFIFLTLLICYIT
ncbi:uncharacterized protein LOC106453357 isoform X1 [Brassica napus]|uniref:uncharacterized protein LOC106352949 isoform X1 n=2 Tax=Brassica napus TaxID=3708 RepID=UPI000BBE51E6|nr:uncharacterized protein LOC106352949 isoform X1 [Brassica napus]XP_022545391.1 uncharacterized protein LOC111199655 isoform X1 [Brassica napus]XP_022548334.1 uncharacterized protein LOC106360964 isoform X1 [Brassica napus]XP_022568791.1 uncharacterized protein LOC106435782 isoform X1 [Brassica napus]XP_022575053.1 uncharacterized protein LOC106451407 isoform X1 [Brassica napus]XP_048602635.1 uncharacterized protein LOC106424044 isoform X1 [Brassica napus]XP_048632736.1 uncharacterized prot